MSFAQPSRAAPPTGIDRDGRATYAHAPARALVKLSHSLTAPLSHTLATKAAATSATSKKATLAAMLEESLLRKFGGGELGGAARAAVHKEVAAAVAGAARVTPEGIRDLQSRVAALIAADQGKVLSTSAPSPLVARSAKATAAKVLSSTDRRVKLAATLSSTGRSVVADGRAKSPAKAALRAAAPAPAAAHSSDESAAGGFRDDGASRATPDRGMRETVGGGTGTRSPGLETLRHHVYADPEPEKVLGLVDEVKAELAKQRAREEQLAKFEAQRAALAAAEKDKAERKARERALEAMWKGVTGETVKDLEGREAQEKAAAKKRDMEQRAIREQQMEAARARHIREQAEKRAYEGYQLKLSMAADEAKRTELLKAQEEKRALVKQQMEENLRALDRKKLTEAARREEERKAMEEYSAMMEAQDRAHKDAVAAMYARQDGLAAVADDKRKQSAAKEEEEKKRTHMEFQEARAAIAAAERADAEARRLAAASYHSNLSTQVTEKASRTLKEHETELAHAKLYQERAAAAERELVEARKARAERHRQYNALLTQQMQAHKQLNELRSHHERDAVLAVVDELEGDDEVLRGVTAKLAKRSADMDAAKAHAASQEAAIREALKEAGLNPDDVHHLL